MLKLLLDVSVRSLPAFASLILSIVDFDRSLLIRGIESNRTLCPVFYDQETRNFACLAPGTNALAVTSAVTSLGMGLFIAALLTDIWVVRSIYGIFGGVLFVGILAYVVSYKKEIFKVEEALKNTDHKFWAKHVPFGANMITVFLSILFSVLSLI